MVSLIENAKSIAVDSFGTLNTAASPTKLPVEHTPNANNVWVDEIPGSVVTANGYRQVGVTPSNNPATLLVNFFKTSDGTQTFIISDNEKVWATVDFSTFTELITGLAPAFQLRAKVIRDKVWFTNGSDAVRTYDGSTVVTLDGTGGTPDVPTGRYIEYHDERVFLYHIVGDRSKLAFSALTDSSGTEITPDDADAWPAANALQIGEGNADFGTGLFVYRGRLYAAKQLTIWRIEGYDEFTYTRVKTRASTGSRFNESIQELDGLVHFIGVDGFYVFDGEQTERVSDIISSGEFGFEGIQQPNLNNHFWTTTTTEEFDEGTVPTSLFSQRDILDSADDQLSLVAAEADRNDFIQAALLDNISIDSSPGFIELAPISNSTFPFQLGPNLDCWHEFGHTGIQAIGTDTSLTDFDQSVQLGFDGVLSAEQQAYTIDLGGRLPIGRVIFRSIRMARTNQTFNNFIFFARVEVNVGSFQPQNQTNGTWVNVGDVPIRDGNNAVLFAGPQDIIMNFPKTVGVQVRLIMSTQNLHFTMTEMEVYRAGYALSGKYISQAFDYHAAPASFGQFAADYSTNGETITFFTQSSADASTWDPEVTVTNGGSIGSTVRRYLRWGCYMQSSNGAASPWVDEAFLGGLYISDTFDAGNDIFVWGPYEVNQNLNGGTVNHYFRVAATENGLSSESWTAIQPGAVIDADPSDQWIQFKMEAWTPSAAMAPVITDVTINWIEGDGNEVQTLQNVGSIIWRNRYWLTAAKKRSTSNNLILIKGKKLNKSPWQRKPWSILAFGMFQGNLYASSSSNGAIYRLDVGTSENGSAMDSFYETKDFTFEDFQASILEALVTLDRSGPWDVSFGLSTDGGLTYVERSIDVAEGSSQVFTAQLHFNIVNADAVRCRVRTNGIDTPFRLHGITLLYRTTPARGTLG